MMQEDHVETSTQAMAQVHTLWGPQHISVSSLRWFPWG